MHNHAINNRLLTSENQADTINHKDQNSQIVVWNGAHITNLKPVVSSTHPIMLRFIDQKHKESLFQIEDPITRIDRVIITVHPSIKFFLIKGQLCFSINDPYLPHTAIEDFSDDEDTDYSSDDSSYDSDEEIEKYKEQGFDIDDFDNTFLSMSFVGTNRLKETGLNKLFSASASSKKIQKYLDHGCNPNSCRKRGDINFGTPLHQRIVNEESENALQFLNVAHSSIDPTVTDGEGKTILIIAAKVNSKMKLFEAIISLFKHNLELDAQDINGATALHYAALYGNLEKVKALVGAGANIKIRDIKGLTPLDWAHKSIYEVNSTFISIAINPNRDSEAEGNTVGEISDYVLNTKGNLQRYLDKLDKKNKPGTDSDSDIQSLRNQLSYFSGKSLLHAAMEGHSAVIEYLKSRE